MAAVVKRKWRNQRSHIRKNPQNQTRKRKTQAKRGRKPKASQVRKYGKKNSRKKIFCKRKQLPLTKKAKGILGSCVEELCKTISSEANRLRKEKCEPKISHEILLAALEKSLFKRKIRSFVTPAIKKVKKKKQFLSDVAKKSSSPSEQQAEPNQKLPKQRKLSASPATE